MSATFKEPPEQLSDETFSPHQSAYFAHWLTRQGLAENTIARAIASARVDMNPHQVEAALFALKSPLSQGVILADEVGLGKTIEAGLVIAQKWAEHKRRILLVVPATLRKQWSQELEEKFELDSVILEAKTFHAYRKAGCNNPFEIVTAEGSDMIVIASYEFAARKKSEVRLVPWDLVIFDEAHKLRNVYKNDGAKTAKALKEALAGNYKLLLSATPFQNTLMELYGLVSVIDDYFFGSADAFRIRYVSRKPDDAELRTLRHRLNRICHRTLRRQVQEEGGIKFTRRYSLTEDFRPTGEEEKLYRLVSEYLQGDNILSIKPGARQLVTLVIRKILASSSFAIGGTLETMIKRLEQRQSIEAALADFDALDDLQDELIDDDSTDSTEQEHQALAQEIDELKGYRQLAANIQQNAKGEALLRVLGRAFEMTERLGGSRKAVIFTESVRTQQYLKELLEKNGYAGRIVLLNGSNNDPASKQLYKDWLVRHQDTNHISGSKTADMKAALVDAFKRDAQILISTEAGGEGINLQFCSLLINYDLPWNPQRVEQRIGRVHRYGQKYDVVVVNFINRGNKADERVFQLLSEKFQLFEGVFGASDEILGAIESGVDIERRILQIYQQCRSDETIEAEFNRLQAELQDELSVREQQTRQAVLENLDADVVRRLHFRRSQIEEDLSEYHHMLLRLAKAELPQAQFTGHYFDSEGQRYELDWEQADESEALFFRPNEDLGCELIERAKSRNLAEATLQLHLGELPMRFSNLEPYSDQSGYLQLAKLTLQTAKQAVEHLLVAAYSDHGEILHREAAERLLLVPGTALPAETVQPDEIRLQQTISSYGEQAKQEAEQQNQQYYDEETEKLERWADDQRTALDLRIKQLDTEIRDYKRYVRQLATLKEKTEARREITRLERERDTVMLNYHEEKKRIEQKEDELLDQIEQALQIEPIMETLFTVRWELHP